MKVIGLIGAKAAGKTTAAKIMRDLGLHIIEITLADKLKNVCAEVFEVPRDWFDFHNFKEKELEVPRYLTREILIQIFTSYDLLTNPDFSKYLRPHIGKVLFTPRQIAQYVGTEVLRSVDPDIHCTSAVKAAAGTTYTEESISVITDMRFPNEFEFFKKSDEFYPIYIKNTAAEGVSGGDAHASEAHLKTLALKANKVENESSLEIFKKNLQNLLINLGVLK